MLCEEGGKQKTNVLKRTIRDPVEALKINILHLTDCFSALNNEITKSCHLFNVGRELRRVIVVISTCSSYPNPLNWLVRRYTANAAVLVKIFSKRNTTKILYKYACKLYSVLDHSLRMFL